jgi:heme exporter protein B
MGWMAAITFLGTLGFSSVGTLLAAVSMNTRMSEVMLPVLLVPLALPVVLSVVLATAANYAHPPEERVMFFWMQVLAAYDIIFVTLPLMTFDYVLEK